VEKLVFNFDPENAPYSTSFQSNSRTHPLLQNLTCFNLCRIHKFSSMLLAQFLTHSSGASAWSRPSSLRLKPCSFTGISGLFLVICNFTSFTSALFFVSFPGFYPWFSLPHALLVFRFNCKVTELFFIECELCLTNAGLVRCFSFSFYFCTVVFLAMFMLWVLCLTSGVCSSKTLVSI